MLPTAMVCVVREVETPSLQRFCDLIKKTFGKTIVIDSISTLPVPSEISEHTFTDFMSRYCKKNSFRLFELEGNYFLTRDFSADNTYPDLTRSSISSTCNEISTFFRSLFSFKLVEFSSSIEWNKFYNSLASQDRDRMDSDRGLVVHDLSTQQQKQATDLIYRCAFAEIGVSWKLLQDLLGSLPRCILRTEYINNFQVLVLAEGGNPTFTIPLSLAEDDSAPINAQGLVESETLPLQRILMKAPTLRIALSDEVAEHPVFLQPQALSLATLRGLCALNRWQMIRVGPDSSSGYRIERRPVRRPTRPDQIAIATLDALPASLERFLTYDRNREDLIRGGHPDHNILSSDQKIRRIQARIAQELRRAVREKTQSQSKFSDLNGRTQRLIFLYVCYFFIGRSTVTLSNAVSVRQPHVLDPQNAVLLHRVNDDRETFEIAHPEGGSFSVRSRRTP